ncbi:hypothetical protein HPP92_028696 [Vanilla planifolia]|uniref:Uncharacterized protein n=1 Tax=Vanilla planifolia TaxID=51239 RepID=A0A835U5D6_VANPL|nr:hypothetical protein HPP92_028696 [Vanilla planifolia]KAG0446774.1 hypothetical protein HPP92_028682 [Vanilla planifolia]
MLDLEETPNAFASRVDKVAKCICNFGAVYQNLPANGTSQAEKKEGSAVGYMLAQLNSNDH